jgi:DNA-directed RNA polymerase subunit RPC12/RpoP
MSLLDRVKSLFAKEPRTYEYWCPNCETTFESPKSDMSTVHCPVCGETRVRSTQMADITA